METGHKIFLLVFLSVGVLFIYVVFIHPSEDTADEVNSDFQQAGNETIQEPKLQSTDNLTATLDTNQTRNNDAATPTENIPYKVVIGKNSQDRKLKVNSIPYRPSSGVAKNPEMLDQEPTEPNPGAPVPLVPVGETAKAPEIPANVPQGQEGNVKLPLATNQNVNPADVNQPGHEEEDDRDVKKVV